jgi:hypothetical protein
MPENQAREGWLLCEKLVLTRAVALNGAAKFLVVFCKGRECVPRVGTISVHVDNLLVI